MRKIPTLFKRNPDDMPEWYHSRDRLTHVAWGGGTRGHLSIDVRQCRYGPYLVDVRIPGIASVRQAVDLLVAFGVLPAEFSSAYTAGRRAAVLEGESL